MAFKTITTQKTKYKKKLRGREIKKESVSEREGEGDAFNKQKAFSLQNNRMKKKPKK